MGLKVKSVEPQGKHNVVTVGIDPGVDAGTAVVVMDGKAVGKIKFESEGQSLKDAPLKLAASSLKIFAEALNNNTLGKSLQSIAEQEQVEQEQVAAKFKPKIGLTEGDQLLEELVDLERRMVEQGVADMLKRKDELRKALLAEVEKVEGNKADAITLQSVDGHVVEFSAANKEFVLKDKHSLAQAIGTDTFFDLAKIGVTDLKKVLSENELQQYGKYEQGKTRTMKIKLKS